MTSNMNTKLRLVRCPRCRKVLQEPQGVPVYACGGCDAKLQAKKRENSTADTTSQRLEDDSLGKRKMDQVFGDQEAGSSSNPQSLVNSINDPDQNSDHNDPRSSNKDQDAAKKVENGKVNAPSGGAEEYSSGRRKLKQLSDDPEPCCSSKQQSLVNSINEPDRNIDHNDPRSSTELSGHEDPQSSPEATAHNIIDQEHEDEDEQDQEQEQDQDQDHYQDEAKKQDNGTIDATSVELEHSLGKQKIEQLSDHHETGCSLNQQLLVNSMNELNQNNDHNEPCSSSELSYHEDPHNGIDHDQDQEFLSCRNYVEFEESSSEFEEANKKIIRDSDGGSNFKSLIAEKLLDTRQKKVAYLDEEDILSEDGSADLFHRQRFERISSVEGMENAQFGGTNYYGYEGSVSSFDGNDNLNPRKSCIGSIGDEYVDSGNRYRFNRRNEFHPLNGRSGKDKHRSTDVRSFYSLNEFHETSKHRAPMIPENPKLERIELLKMVRELQDQLERTNIANPQHVPLYYNNVLNNPGRYGQRMAFSGEATAVNRRRDRSSCHHCCPQDRHFSTQLPHQHVCCGQHFGAGAGTYYSPRCSGPSTPKHYSESEFSAPDDQRPRNEVTRPYHSPKKKRYVRPIAGGSPWITCYRCSKLLQLPQSFLVFKKRYHSLRCGACMKVLNFTLLNGTHVSRYYPEETIAAPPSSEVEDYDRSNESRAGPVSCSDRSFQKSYSTETDRIGSWRELSEERRKAAMSRDPSGSTQASSSKMSGWRKNTSEIEEVGSGPNGSPLHWLMGYASPSKVIRS